MIVKICGITNLEDALAAVEAGADMLGFNFYPESPRYLTPAACASIVRELRLRATPLTCVGVFVNSNEADIRAILEVAGLDLAQLSGDEPVEMLARLGNRVFKAVRFTKEGATLQAVESFIRLQREEPPAFLLDSTVKGVYGGTGITADWNQARGLAERFSFLLAGGLTPENVGEAVRRVRPWGVDVASGVESTPGKKDERKVRQFIRNAHTIESRATDIKDTMTKKLWR